MLSIHTVMFTQQGLGHSCMSGGGTQPSFPAGPGRNSPTAGYSLPIKFRDHVLDSEPEWLHVGEAASANGSVFSLGLNRLGPPTESLASGPHGKVTLAVPASRRLALCG